MATKRCRQMTLDSFGYCKKKDKSEPMEVAKETSPEAVAKKPTLVPERSLNAIPKNKEVTEDIEEDSYGLPSLFSKCETHQADAEDVLNAEKDLFSNSLEEDAEHLSPSLLEEDTSLDLEIEALNCWPECAAVLPTLVPSANHSVMFRFPFETSHAPPSHPDSYRDKWDSNHVRMPCSQLNRFPTANKEHELICRWEIICEALTSNIRNVADLEDAIMRYNRDNSWWDFRGLKFFFEDCVSDSYSTMFFSSLLPKIAALALRLPEICTQPLPLLKKHKDHAITLSQKQISCLLANAFFCTFPRRNRMRTNSEHEYSNYPDINFNKLYSANGLTPRTLEKLKCILNYFSRVTSEEPTGTVTFHRQYLQSFPNWAASKKMVNNAVLSTKGLIETKGKGMLQVDFANRFVGGGVLRRGCVQEEIRFIICPDLIISRLFTECLSDSECLIITGVEQYNKYTGYGDTFLWDGDFIDTTTRDFWGRRYCQVVAIDATHFQQGVEQFSMNRIRRELNKAYVGFYNNVDVQCRKLPAVATGNWGCGAFRGNANLKFLIQLMAASQAGREMLYFTFANEKLREELKDMHMHIQAKKLSIGDIWMLLEGYCSHVKGLPQKSWPPLYDFVYNVHLGEVVDQ